MPISSFDSELQQLVDSMAVMMYSNDGVGLAGPQAGVSRRLVLIDPSSGEEANQLMALINPKVIWSSSEREVEQEGCLSLPRMVLQVPRSLAVDVEYHDVKGASHKMRCEGLRARIVQHELDHLDGVMMFDRVGDMTRRLALKGFAKR